jgi:hypothetical protein
LAVREVSKYPYERRTPQIVVSGLATTIRLRTHAKHGRNAMDTVQLAQQRPTWPAMTWCPECAGERQDDGEACPHCGSYSIEHIEAREDLAPGLAGVVERVRAVRPATMPATRGRAYYMARLQRDFPELAAAVEAGKLSARAAAVRAGLIRPKSDALA